MISLLEDLNNGTFTNDHFRSLDQFVVLIFNGIIIEIAANYRYNDCYSAEEHKVQCPK
jgi:hypothetical protein